MTYFIDLEINLQREKQLDRRSFNRFQDIYIFMLLTETHQSKTFYQLLPIYDVLTPTKVATTNNPFLLDISNA